MGQGGTYKCSKCEYELDVRTGMGFLYPVICEENMEKAKKGELGEELRKFFEEHPDGRLDCSNILVRCEDCGAYDTVIDLSMYIPKDGLKPNDAVWDLDGYEKLQAYKHTCSVCSGEMKKVKANEELTCPECGEKLERVNLIMWD